MAQVKYSFPRQFPDTVWRFMWVKNNFQKGHHENRVIMGVQDVLYKLMGVMEGTQDQRWPWYISSTSVDVAMGSWTSWFRLSRARGF